MTKRYALGTAALFLTLVAGGCGGSPRANFYTLVPSAGPMAPPERAVPTVCVGPVTLPEMVDRPQLVERVAANRVEVLESHRWAEPLKSEIPRLVAEDLGALLGSSRVVSCRQMAGVDPEYRVLLDLIRFESTRGEGVTVETVWTVRGAALKIPKTGRSLVQLKPDGVGYDALVAAYSRALSGLSGEIAAVIRAEAAAAR